MKTIGDETKKKKKKKKLYKKKFCVHSITREKRHGVPLTARANDSFTTLQFITIYNRNKRLRWGKIVAPHPLDVG